MKKVLCVCYTLISVVLAKPRIIISSDQKELCNSQVYCQGLLLDTVQRARIFSDSKTFVDLSQVNPPAITLHNFENLMQATNNKPSKEQIVKFVNENFVESAELEEWTPKDFNPNPKFLAKIKDRDIRQFARDLVNIWPQLGRKIGATVFENPDKHSLIGVPNGIIIPGGRFKEFYYWDSYWIIEGLLHSEMFDTAKGMIENLLFMVEKYGFVPNGGRVYYLNRSQPPLLTLMASIYFEQTNDIKWIQKYIGLLDKELSYWLDKKTVRIAKDGNSYWMAHYLSQSDTPRPESYFEDINTCSFFINNEEKKQCYQGLKSGAESGWDFSSRWFFDQEGGAKTNLSHIDAQRVVPVDLNAFLCLSFKRLSSFYNLLGDSKNATKWSIISQQWFRAIEDVLYDENDGIWYDYDTILLKPRKMFFPSNFAPLWTKSYNLVLRDKYGRKAAEYFNNLNIGDYKGGIPTSLNNNNEQWDLPNAWPPLQEFVILGLWSTGNRKARKIAQQSAERWIQSNLLGFTQQAAMFEKYDATKLGQNGGGGEYDVQKGFGWSNGASEKQFGSYLCGANEDNLFEKFIEEPAIITKAFENSEQSKNVLTEKENLKDTIKELYPISYETSGDELSSSSFSPRKSKGILKRMSSNRAKFGRSVSKSSLDDFLYSSFENYHSSMFLKMPRKKRKKEWLLVLKNYQI